jgi:REP element-mobilizing transposase RayT
VDRCFTRLNQKVAILDSLKYCQQQKGLEIYAYVLMPSHMHMLCRAKEEYELANIIRDFKNSLQKTIQLIKEEPESRREWLLEIFSKACTHLKREKEYKVWQHGYHAEEISSNKFID